MQERNYRRGMGFRKEMHTEPGTNEHRLPQEAKPPQAPRPNSGGETPLAAAPAPNPATGPGDHEQSRQRKSLAEFS
jgi:hypothetical protein